MITEQLSVGGETLTFGIRPFAFFQTNTRAAELLYQTAFDTLRRASGDQTYETVIDLYCGTGTIGQCAIAAGIARRTIGVEIVQAAVDDANDNATRNNLADRCTYICGKAEAVVNDSLLTDV